MIKLLFIILISLLFQACQVSEDVASSKQIGGVNFPGANITAVPPADGWRKLGANIDISILFPLPITVTGFPYIEAYIGSNVRRMYYYSGNGTGILIFRYTVTSADLDTSGVEFGSSVVLNGGGLTYASNNATVENLPLDFSMAESDVKVDGVVPTLSTITPPTGGNYATGQLLKYQLAFSEKVYVSGTPYFDVNLTSGAVSALYRNGSGSTKLQFARLLQATDDDSDGFATGTTLNLSVLTGATITDEAGNSLSTTMASTNSSNVLINVVEPTITLITPPADATYTAGQNLDFTITMSEAVNVTGEPSIPIQLTTGTALAKYISGTGTTSLTFRYTVLTNHVDTNGVTLLSPMILNGGTIRNIADTQNAALIYTAPVTTGILVDAATGPYVTFSIADSAGMYVEGDNIEFTLNFSRAVTITGTPRLPVIVGSTTFYANYISGSGSSALLFRYSPLTTHEDLDGIALSGPIDLSVGGSSIIDIDGKNAILSYVPPSTSAILVDGTSPTITSITTANTDNLNLGDQLDIDVQFSEIVNVSGTPTLSIDVGVTTYTINYISGDGTNTLKFRHTVASGDIDSDGIDVTSPMTAGISIKDARNHTATLTFGATNLSGFVVDAEKSNITALTPVADATYKIGDIIDFVVDWSEPTFASGFPKIPLTVGINTYYANYEPSVSSDTQFVFRWIVPAGASAPGGISMSSIIGGTMQDAYGNNADISMVIPNISGIIIDGIVPSVASLVSPATGTYKAGQALNFVLTWSENVTFTGQPHLSLIIGSTTVQALCSATVSSTSTTCTYTIQTGDLDLNGITRLSAIFLDAGEKILDDAGNNAYLQLNSTDLTGVKVDAVPPKVAAIIPPPNETYKLTENIDFTIMWTEPVTITGTPRIALTLDTAAAPPTYLTYVPASSTSTTSVFRYTVVQNDEDSNGIAITSPIDLNTGTIRDAATNDADLTFLAPVLSGILVDGIKAVISSIAAPTSDTYGIGDNIDYVITWSENVDVDTTGGVPYVRICVSSYWSCSIIPSRYRNAVYVSGSGTASLTFRYTVTAGDTDVDGVWMHSPVILNGGTINDSNAGNAAYLTFTSLVHTGVKVDGTAPYITTATSTNVTSASRPNYFKPNQTIQYNLTFNEIVNVTGTPRIELDIGGNIRYANYYAGTGTTTLSFRFTIDAGDVLLDLDGITLDTSSIDLNGGTIQDNAGNDYAGAIPFSENDYVYFTDTVARYHFSGSDYASSSCGGTDQCINTVTDITGNGNTLAKSIAIGAVGPKVLSGFGGNSTMYAQFNSSSLLRTTSSMPVRYAIIVMKTVSNGSTSSSTSNHNIFMRRWSSSWSFDYTAATLTSNSSSKGFKYDVYSGKLKINDGTFVSAYSMGESAPGLWAGSTNYIYSIEYSSAAYFYPASYFGGSTFNGQIAEIVLLSGGVQTESQIDRIVTQLNAIHDVY